MTDVGDFVRALAAEYDDVDDVRRARSETPNDQRRLLDALMGAVERLAIDDLRRGLALGADLLRAVDACADAPHRVGSRRVYAQALAYASRLDDALIVLDEAIEIAGDDASCAIDAGRSRLVRLHALARLARFDDALREGELARGAFLAAGEPALAGRADLNLGVTHRMRGDSEQALLHFDRARAAIQGEPIVAAQLESNRAEALLDCCRFAEAEDGFRRAHAVFDDAGFVRAAAIAEGNLADLMSRQGRLADALRHFESARRSLTDDESPGERARVIAEQAEAFTLAGLLDEAVRAYVSSSDVLMRLGLEADGARALAGLGCVLAMRGRHDDAAQSLARAETIFARLDHRPGLARVDLMCGLLAERRRDLDGAVARFASVLSRLDGDHVDAVVAEGCLANLAVEAGDMHTAVEALERALPAAERLGLAAPRSDLLRIRSRLRRAQGDRTGALDDLRAAVNEIERQRGRLGGDRLRAAFLGERASVYADLVSTLLERDDPGSCDEAFATAERARSRSLLDLVDGAVEAVDLARARSTDPEEGALLDEVIVIQGELNALLDASERFDGDTASRRARIDRVRDREEQLRLVESRLASTRSLEHLFAPPVDAATVRARLPEGAALVAYFAAGGRLLAFLIRHDGAAVYTLGREDEMIPALDYLAFQIARAAGRVAQGGHVPAAMTADAVASLQRMHDLIFAPLRPALGDVRRLYVVPHGRIHAVPFAALHDGDAHLVETMELVQAPSASWLCRPAPAPSAAPPVVVGVSDELAPGIEREAAVVAARLGAAVVIRGAEATIDRFRAVAQGASLLHVACHGRFVRSSPGSSGLRLHDGWLSARAVEGMRLGGATVVLSGCETGAAAVEHGQEVMGLARSFLAAGAASLVQSLWLVSDEAAGGLMSDLYRGDGAVGTLVSGGSPATALAEAQRRCLIRRPHPLYWAPFIAVERM